MQYWKKTAVGVAGVGVAPVGGAPAGVAAVGIDEKGMGWWSIWYECCMMSTPA